MATKKSCIIEGVVYESEGVAAKALGVTAETVRYRLRSSNYPGYTSEYHPRVNVRPKGYPCRIDGVEYESEAAAARALNIPSAGTIHIRLISPDFPEYVSEHKPKVIRKRIISCSVDGTEYDSIKHAARKLGISITLLKKRLASVEYPDYVCADIPKKLPKYTVAGKPYKTLQEIANVEGLTRERIRQKMNSPTHPDYISVDIPKGPPPPKYMVKDKGYRTVREIADAEGMDMTQIRRKIADPSCTEYRRLYKKRP